jgi:HK97 family phage prohead protease
MKMKYRGALPEIERRGALPVEIRKDEGVIRVRGHAAVFNQEADIAGFFREVVRPGAFDRAIVEDDVPFLIEHEGLPLARNTSGTLKLSQDDRGLLIESTLDANDPDVQRIVPKMERGDLSKMSFAFMPRGDDGEKWSQDEKGMLPLRELLDVQLFDVSIVTTPAYEGTDIGLRSLEKWRADSKAEEEAAQRRHNFHAASMRIRLSRSLELKHRKV